MAIRSPLEFRKPVTTWNITAVFLALVLHGIMWFVARVLFGDSQAVSAAQGQMILALMWMIGAIAAMIATGVPLFLSEPIKLYYSDSFWVKMITLPIAIAFAFTVRPRFTVNAVRNTARRQWLVGALSIALWVVVAAAGRWIGFS